MMSNQKSSRLAVVKIMMPIAVTALLTAKFAESNAQTIIVTSGKDNHFEWKIQNVEQEPLVMVDGQKSSFEEVQKTNVKSIRVVAGQPAKDEYGENGSNGVVEITTKDSDSDTSSALEENPIGQVVIRSNVKADGEVVNNWNVETPPAPPLVIIDGEEGTLESVNSSDIKSMVVLKDKSAIEQYGEKAANGVVIITTKKNKKAEKGKE